MDTPIHCNGLLVSIKEKNQTCDYNVQKQCAHLPTLYSVIYCCFNFDTSVSTLKCSTLCTLCTHLCAYISTEQCCLKSHTAVMRCPEITLLLLLMVNCSQVVHCCHLLSAAKIYTGLFFSLQYLTTVRYICILWCSHFQSQTLQLPHLPFSQV